MITAGLLFQTDLFFQIKLLGSSDATSSPCIGLIVSPYTSGTPESEILSYWVSHKEIWVIGFLGHSPECGLERLNLLFLQLESFSDFY